MMSNYSRDQHRANSFYQNNKKDIKSLFNGDIFSIEFDDSKLAKMLDQKCGIDYLLLMNGASVFGIASRINFNSTHHNSITIRYKRTSGGRTEYQKRIEAIKSNSGEIYATITMQIDAENEKPVRAMIFESDKLYLFIDQNLDTFIKRYQQTNHCDGNKFFKIPYDEMIKMSAANDFKVKIIQF